MCKSLLAAIVTVAAAAPAVAQPSIDPRDEQLVRSLPAPHQVEAVAGVVDAAVGAILDVPVGPLREAIDPGRALGRHERDETLGDVASRDDPYFRDRMRSGIANASTTMGILSERLAILAPVLRDTIEDAERRIDDAIWARSYPRD